MHTGSPFLKSKIASAFVEFTNEMRILPDDTPLILADTNGAIKKSKNLPSDFKIPFPTLAKFIDKDDFKLCYDEMSTKGVCAVRTSADNKCFLVISLCENSLLRCIGASFHENGSLSLDDYLLKLCSYKDYLDSFERFHYDTDRVLPFIKMLKSRISGASSLIEISNAQNPSQDKKHIIVSDLFKMLDSFIKASDFPIDADINTICDNNLTTVLAGKDFIKLCVSLAGIVLKMSKHGDISFISKEEGDSVLLTFATACAKPKTSSLYESAVLRALTLHTQNCHIDTQNGGYSITLKMKTVARPELIVGDVQREQQYLFYSFTESVVRDIFLAASDFVF